VVPAANSVDYVSMKIVFQVNDRTATMQGSLFITSEFGAGSMHFGGPSIYTGAAILFEIVSNQIAFEYRVNNGKVFRELDSDPPPHN
jgi:hypothetical protein